MPSELERATARFRRSLLAQDARSRAAVQRSYRAAIASLRSELRAALDAIAAIRAQGGDVPTWRLLQEQRVRQLLARAEIEFARHAATVQQTTIRAQQDAIRKAQDDSVRLIEAGFGPPPAGAVLPVHTLPLGAIQQLTATLQPNAPVRRLLQEFAGDAVEAVQDELVGGVAAGNSPQQITRAITNRLGREQRARAERIVRTESMRAFRESTRATMVENKHLVEKWVWYSGLGTRTCAVCWALHGKEFDVDTKMATHPNCFPAGTVVEGPRAVGSTVRWYDGDLVDIRLSSGTLLSVTPNHPILTPQGWKLAGALGEGDDVVGGLRAERIGPLVNPDDYHGPSLIEDVAVAIGRTAGVTPVSMPTTAEDFHGDGIDGEVCVVRTDGRLRNAGDAPFFEPHSQQLLCRRHAKLFGLTGLGATAFLIERMDAAPDGFLSGASVFPALFGRSGGNEQSVGFGLVAARDAVFGHVPGDDVPRNAERVGDGLLGFTGGVATSDVGGRQFDSIVSRVPRLAAGDGVASGTITEQSASPERICEALFAGVMPSGGDFGAIAREVVVHRVLNVFRRRWQGHVYNLQTTTGWYIANGIITHNCRCVLMPNTKSWRDLGYDVPDTRQAVPTGPDLFAKLSADDQHAILGPGAYAAYRAGDVALPDFVGVTRSKVWGSGRRRVSLATAQGRAANKTATPTPPPPPPNPVAIPVGNALTLPPEPSQLWRDTAQKIRGDIDIRAVAQDALRDIDAVHKDGTLPTIPIKTDFKQFSPQAARFSFSPSSGQPVEIGVSEMKQFGPTARTNFIHEVGHFLDFSGIGGNGKFASYDNPLMERWRDAVNSTRAVRSLRDDLARGSRDIALSDGTTRTYPMDTKYLDYLLDSSEVWARSYTQYVAKRSGNPATLRELIGNQENKIYADQWDADDFAPVERAIDDLFRGLGWIG